MNDFQRTFKDTHARDTDTWQVKDQQTHGREVRSMFARISGVYDFMNHFLSLNQDQKWRDRVAARIDSDAWEVLDLCAGTGDLALACRKGGKGRTWIAADFCPEMLLGSRGKQGAEQLQLAAADGMNLPFRDRKIDAVTVGFGVRNFADVRRGSRRSPGCCDPVASSSCWNFFVMILALPRVLVGCRALFVSA